MSEASELAQSASAAESQGREPVAASDGGARSGYLAPHAAEAGFVHELNSRLAHIYGALEELENQMLTRGHGLDVTIAESRLIEAVGDRTFHSGRTISVTQIARALGIRVPSATAAVNRLVVKALLAKRRSSHDARRVDVSLTREGEKTYRLQRIFHRETAEAVALGMSGSERELMLEGLSRLERFYVDHRRAL